MYVNTHVLMTYSEFLKSLPGRFSDFRFFFLLTHSGTEHLPVFEFVFTGKLGKIFLWKIQSEMLLSHNSKLAANK